MLGYTWTELGVGDYLKDQNTESKFIEDEYVDPTDVEVVFPEQKKKSDLYFPGINGNDIF